MADNKTDIPTSLAYFLVNDFGGMTRGRGVPSKNIGESISKGVGWVPINQTITPFDDIPYPGQWGPVGDCRLVPAPSTEVKINMVEPMPPLHFFLSDIYDLDNNPSAVCPRNFLKETLSEFQDKTGLSIVASFEHEFIVTNLLSEESAPGFSYRKARNVEPFASALMAAMEAANLAPENFLPEFGAHQYEVTSSPSNALKAADRAIALREIVREVAKEHGHETSFSPKVDLDGFGSGVHIHFSFKNEAGVPVTFDPDREGNMSETAGMFAAGIVKHLPALCAFTVPSVISYQRIKPHSWSAAYTCLGEHNREAAVRISPTFDPENKGVESQFNLEFRVVDATANPYIALAMMIKSGLEGISQKYPQPPLVNTDPADLSPEEAQALGVKRLPESLPEALTCWQEDPVASCWMNSVMKTSYLALKTAEIESTKDKTDDEICGLYRDRY